MEIFSARACRIAGCVDEANTQILDARRRAHAAEAVRQHADLEDREVAEMLGVPGLLQGVQPAPQQERRVPGRSGRLPAASRRQRRREVSIPEGARSVQQGNEGLVRWRPVDPDAIQEGPAPADLAADRFGSGAGWLTPEKKYQHRIHAARLGRRAHPALAESAWPGAAGEV